METEGVNVQSNVVYQEGRIRHRKEKAEEPLPSRTGLHTHSVKIGEDGSFPYPLRIETVASYYKGCKKSHDYTPDIEIIDTVPEIRSYRSGGAMVKLTMSYKLLSDSYSGGSMRGSNKPQLHFEHLIVFREADDVSLNVTG